MNWIVEEKWLAVKKSLLLVLTYRGRICQANNLLFFKKPLEVNATYNTGNEFARSETVAVIFFALV